MDSTPWPYAAPATEKNLELVEISKQLRGTPQSDGYEKMISGLLYDPFLPALVEGRLKARCLCAEYNSTDMTKIPSDELFDHRFKQFQKIVGRLGEKSFVEAPFYTDYGFNVSIGSETFINWGMSILDTSLVVIGDRVLFGTNVSLITASHETSVRSRRKGVEFGHSIFIGNDCWIGANVTVLPGVKIGDGSTVGAGSVVTRDIPPYSVAVGSPARVKKKIPTPEEEEEEERRNEGTPDNA